MANEPTNSDLLGLTAKIVAAHAANNDVDAADLTDVIRAVYGALNGLSDNPASEHAGHGHVHVHLHPAVPPAESVFPDYIVCLEDGKRLKMLKRHLSTSYGLTPEQYRHKWGLPPEYPMVAPNYAAKRSALAKQIGLGTHRSDR